MRLTGFLPHLNKNSAQVLGRQTGQNGLVSNLNCQESLTESSISVENRDNKINSSKMGTFGKLAGALALSTAVSAQAEAQDFGATCKTLEAGETISVPITPETLPGVYDAQKQISRAALQAFSKDLGTGLSKSCGFGDIGVYVMQVGDRTELAIYPPGENPLGIDGETYQEIQAHYRACIAEAAEFADENGNDTIEAGREARYLEEDEEACAKTAADRVTLAQLDQRITAAQSQIASAQARQAAARARMDATFETWTQDILNGS